MIQHARQQQAARPGKGAQAPRMVTTYRVGKLTTAAGPLLCIVRTLSDRRIVFEIDGPCVVDAEAVLEIGRERIAGTLSRIGDKRVALDSTDAIDLDIILADPSILATAGRRALPRVEVAVRARLDIGAHRLPVTVEDISTDGVKVFSEELLSVGDEVRIVLRGIERPMPGVVRWCGGDYAGVEFLQRLPITALNAWLAEHAGADADGEPAWAPPVISKS